MLPTVPGHEQDTQCNSLAGIALSLLPREASPARLFCEFEARHVSQRSTGALAKTEEVATIMTPPAVHRRLNMSFNATKPQIKEELHKKWAIQAVELALMGHWDEAEQANQRILEVFPDDTRARNRLGRAYSELGRYDEAATAYEQSLERQPSNSIARKKLTELYTLLKRDPDVALGETAPDSESTEEDEQKQALEEERVQDGPDEDRNADDASVPPSE